MLCRVAEQIFWMSRYIERAVAVSRLVDVTLHLELDAGDLEDETELWAPLLGARWDRGLGAWRDRTEERGHAPTSRDVRHCLTFDLENPDSLLSCVRSARAAARGVRESISSEMWERLNTLHLSLVDPRLAQEAEENPHAFYSRVREGAQYFQGLAESTLMHDEDWHFIRLGMYLERCTNVARSMELQSHLLVLNEQARHDDTVRWLAVLRSCGSAEGYARYYSLRVEPARVIEFLLLNPLFPQSLRFGLNTAWSALSAIAHGRDATQAGRLVGANPGLRALGLLRARLEHAAVDEILEEGLKPFLQDLQARIAAVSDDVTRTYLRDEPRSRPAHVPSERAALLMAAQQQQ